MKLIYDETCINHVATGHNFSREEAIILIEGILNSVHDKGTENLSLPEIEYIKLVYIGNNEFDYMFKFTSIENEINFVDLDKHFDEKQ